jgi:hypothetical protein
MISNVGFATFAGRRLSERILCALNLQLEMEYTILILGKQLG